MKGGGLLQQARRMRAVHQGRQGRDQMDATVRSLLRRQRCAPSASRAGLQSRQLPAHAGDALADKALVYDHAARKADQDRREGRRSRALCLVPDGGGGHSSKSLRRHFAAHRRVTTVAGDVDSVRRSTFTRSLQTTGDMRLDDRKIRTFSAGRAVIIKLGLAGVCVEDSALPAAVEGGNLWLKTAGIR